MTISIIRAFIAIDLSTEIQQRLNDVLDNYKTLLSKIPIRWVPVTNIHLTLKFLGELSTSNLNILTDMIKTEVTSHHQFEISVGGSGAFPNIRQPRIIWVGVEAPPELASIQIGIESATARLGYAREERAFSPHLTIGRISRNVSMLEVKVISQTLENNRVGFLGAICIEKVHLYRSDLQPTGAVYTRIFTASLNS
jgi:2'-5' RNA ligase